MLIWITWVCWPVTTCRWWASVDAQVCKGTMHEQTVTGSVSQKPNICWVMNQGHQIAHNFNSNWLVCLTSTTLPVHSMIDWFIGTIIVSLRSMPNNLFTVSDDAEKLPEDRAQLRCNGTYLVDTSFNGRTGIFLPTFTIYQVNKSTIFLSENS